MKRYIFHKNIKKDCICLQKTKSKNNNKLFLLSISIENQSILVGNRQFCTSFSATAGKHFSSVFSCHAAAESVFVFSLRVRGLKCSFHRCYMFFIFFFFEIRGAKIDKIVELTNFYSIYFKNKVEIALLL